AELVRLMVVERDAPAEARKYTFLLEDEAARRNVSWAAGDVDQLEAEQALALGGWYESLVAQAEGAGSQAAMMRRAISAYDRYLESDPAEGLGRMRATLVRKTLGDRLASLEQKLGPTSRPSTGRWMDLLALVKPELHTRRSSSPGWEKRDGVLHSTAKIASIALPVILEGSYELEMKFQRGESDKYTVLEFPVGGRSVSLYLSSSLSNLRSGLALVDGMRLKDERNPTGFDWVTEEGKPYTLALKVVVRGEEAAIRVAIDGKTRIEWSGPWEQLRPRWPSDIGHNFVLVAYFCPVQVSAIRLRTSGGKPKAWEGRSREEERKKPDRPGADLPDAVVAERIEMIQRMWVRLGEPQRREVLEWLRNSNDPRAKRLYKELRR
ncbi:MAG: hypothetical protein OER86_13710, partial [Phycisphaerae bacterium]|nr:hypothetical protein [Phycisphaerae bacterium]